jgi:hypothetical protein
MLSSVLSLGAILSIAALAPEEAASAPASATNQHPRPDASAKVPAPPVMVSVEGGEVLPLPPPVARSSSRPGTGSIYRDNEEKISEAFHKLGREIARELGWADLPDPPPSGKELLEQWIIDKGGEASEETLKEVTELLQQLSKSQPTGPDPRPTPAPGKIQNSPLNAPAPAPHPTPTGEKEGGGLGSGGDDFGDGGGEINDVPKDALDRAKSRA